MMLRRTCFWIRWLAIGHCLVNAQAFREAAAEVRPRALLCVAAPVQRWPRNLTGLVAAAAALRADVLAVVTGPRGPLRHSVAAALRGSLGRTLASLVEREDAEVEDVWAEARRASNSSAALLAAYRRMGALFLTPLVKGDTSGGSDPSGQRNVLPAFDLRDCLMHLEAHSARERDRPYSHFGFARADLDWMTPPPPLPLMQRVAPAAAWIPDTMDWDGLHDRFALLPRTLAHIYFDRLTALLDGSALPRLRGLLPRPPYGGRIQLGYEWLLLATLRIHGVQVARFSAVAAVTCSDRVSTCTVPLGPRQLRYKHQTEFNDAARTAEALRLAAGPWAWREGSWPPLLEPPCFEDEPLARTSCLHTGAGLKCWDAVYSFMRCCPALAGAALSRGLFVTPPPALARRLRRELGGDLLCTHVTGTVKRCVDLAALSQEDGDISPESFQTLRLGRSLSTATQVLVTGH